MKRILFPIDFSDNSLNAFRYALHFADAMGGEIITLHVYDGPEGFYQEYYDFLIENYTVTEWSEFENYKSEVPKLRRLAEDCHMEHVPLSHILERGIILNSIKELTASEKVDYIVMGTQGASGLGKILMGSLTEKVINACDVPVLAIPSKCFYQPIRKILFLCHYKKTRVGVLNELLGTAALFHAQIDVLQVQKHHEEDENVLVSEWRAMFPDPDIAFYNLIHHDYEGIVMDFMKSNNESMVAIARHHKNFIDRLLVASLSRELAFHSSIPLLALPA